MRSACWTFQASATSTKHPRHVLAKIFEPERSCTRKVKGDGSEGAARGAAIALAVDGAQHLHAPARLVNESFRTLLAAPCFRISEGYGAVGVRPTNTSLTPSSRLAGVRLLAR